MTADFHVAVTATGCYTPEHVMDNAELIRHLGLDTTPEWIESRTGVQSRHWMTDDQTTSDMAVEAARRIIAERGVRPEELDRIILATSSPDLPSPATATIVGRKLGSRCPAFDISAACAGFLYALDLGAASVRNGDSKVLVLAADARSRFVDKSDRRTAALFADGAGGVLLEPSAEPGLLSIQIGSEGQEHLGAHIPAGGASLPTSAETVAQGHHFLVVDEYREIYDNFIRFTREACDQALTRAGLLWDDVDTFITHQGNARIVENVAKDLGLREAQVVNQIHQHGNTSAATVPIALTESLSNGRIQPGDTVLLTAVGAGYTYGAAVVRF